jgi:hypothetical protein
VGQSSAVLQVFTLCSALSVVSGIYGLYVEPEQLSRYSDGLRAWRLGLIPGRGKNFFFIVQRPDRLWNPSRLPSNTYLGLFLPREKWQGHTAHHSPPSNAEIKNGAAIPLLHPTSSYTGTNLPLVGTATGFVLGGRGSIPGRGNFFLFSTASRPAVGITQPPIQMVPGTLSLGGGKAAGTWSWPLTSI